MRLPTFVTTIFPLALAGCAGLPGLDAGLQTAGAIVDTAAVVRARQLGLCADSPVRPVATPEDALARQAEIEALKADLALLQRQLTEIAIAAARRQVAP